MSGGGSWAAETHDWVAVDSDTGCALPFQIDVAAPDAGAADQPATTSLKLKTAYEEGVVEGVRRAEDNAQQAYTKGYRVGSVQNEEKVVAMHAQCNARIRRFEEQRERVVMRLEADLENSRRDVVRLKNRARAEGMVTAMTATHHECMNTLRKTVEHYKQQWEDKVAENKYLRAQVAELKEEVAQLAANEAEVEAASELGHGLQAQIERQKATIIGMRKQVTDALNAGQAKEAQLCSQLRVAVRDHEATKSHHRSLAADTSDAVNELGKVRRELAETKKALNAKSEDVAERDELDEIDQLLQRQQLSHAELVQELEVAKAKCTQFEEEAALHKEDRERLEDAKRKLKSSAEQFDRLRTDYFAEKGKVDKLKAELAEMTLYKQDEYAAAQERQTELEEEQWKAAEAEPEPDSDPEPVAKVALVNRPVRTIYYVD